jgi:tetratricopeptide (TPR) repeat protein
MNWRYGLALALVVVLAAGCATTPTAAGSVALREGRPSDAVAHFERALADNPDRLDALVGLGIAHYRLGAYPEAIAALTDAANRAPDHAGARLFLALSYIRTRDDARARENLEALRLRPLEPRLQALISQAIDLLSAGGVTDAVRTYMVASLDYGADWSRELAETRGALRRAELMWDPFWTRPVYVIRARRR